MKIFLILLLVIHGAIHSLGFVKSWNLASVPQLHDTLSFAGFNPYSRIAGCFWVLAFLVLIAAAWMLATKRENWWMFAILGVALSQFLVAMAWSDAKFGTLANMVLVLPIITAGATSHFERQTKTEVHALLTRSAQSHHDVVSPAAIDELPRPVQRWLRASGVLHRPMPRSVYLKQRGAMRLAPDQDALRVDAEQYFRVDEPEFIWQVQLKMLHFLPVIGRDTLLEGHGQMLIKLAGIFPVVNEANDKIDQGALLRFLGEMVWFPAAALHSQIQWRAIDEHSAKATLTHRGKSVHATFFFDDEGRFIRLLADRYYGGGVDAKLEKWEVEAQAWKTMAGCQVPVRGEVRWKLEQGDFTFYQWELVELAYDPTQARDD